MKAIQVPELGDPELMKLKDVPDPRPGAGQVVVKVEAVGVNPVDTYIRAGIYAISPKLPYTPGIDAAGTVESVGEGVSKVKAGERVYTAGALNGTYAEKALCAESQIFPLPDAASFSQGAALGVPYGTAYRGLFHRAAAQPGETILIHGASGGVGIAAIQMAKAAGMTVIGTGGSESSAELIRDQGADHVVDHHDPAHFEEILELTRGNGVNVILEMLANANLGNDLPVLAKGGRVVLIGSRGPVEIDARDLMARDADIRGMTLMNLTNDERESIHAGIRAGLHNGTLSPVIDREYPLVEACRAHHEVLETSTHGKIVLLP